MAEYLVNLGEQGLKADAPFVNLNIYHTTQRAIGDGWTIHYIPGFSPEFDVKTLPDSTPSGDAAWVNQLAAVKTGHRPGTGGAKLLLAGDPNTQIVVDVYSNSGDSSRIVTWDLNGGPPQSIETDTLTETITLTGSTDANGEATLTYADGGGSTFGPYSNALRITTVEGPSVTLSADLQPGQPFTATATNFASAPVSPATITDASANSITVPVTVTDDGGGTYTVTGTMPALTGGGTSPKFGQVTLELVTA